VVSEWYRSGIRVKSKEWKEVGVTLRMMTRGRSDPGESNPPRSQAAGHAGGSGVRGR
jgi:hypothetical protein